MPKERLLHIYCFGDLSHEVSVIARRAGWKVSFFVDKGGNLPPVSYSGIQRIGENSSAIESNPPQYALVATGDPRLRESIVIRIEKRFPECIFPTLLDPACLISDPETVKIGRGTIVQANTIITCDTTIGEFCYLNFNVGVGRATMGDFSTLLLGAQVAGDSVLGKRVYVGGNATIKDKVTVCDDAIIGMGATVVKDITEPGTYVGVPARRIK